jgi:alkylhydroperoxidase family enzyme
MSLGNADRFGPELEAVFTGLEVLLDSLWAQVPDPALVELCRLRMATLLKSCDPALGNRPGIPVSVDPVQLAALGHWWDSPRFDSRERAYLEFTEQFVTSVRDISDEQVQALREHDDDDDVYVFVAVLYVLELTQRTTMVLDRVLEPQEVSL